MPFTATNKSGPHQSKFLINGDADQRESWTYFANVSGAAKAFWDSFWSAMRAGGSRLTPEMFAIGTTKAISLTDSRIYEIAANAEHEGLLIAGAWGLGLESMRQQIAKVAGTGTELEVGLSSYQSSWSEPTLSIVSTNANAQAVGVGAYAAGGAGSASGAAGTGDTGLLGTAAGAAADVSREAIQGAASGAVQAAGIAGRAAGTALGAAAKGAIQGAGVADTGGLVIAGFGLALWYFFFKK